MNKSAAKVVLHEMRNMLPPTVFFAVGFNALVLTIYRLSDQSSAMAITHTTACIGALLVAKGVIVAEMLPFFNKFESAPRIASIFWKSSLYFLFTTLLHTAERAFAASRNAKGFDAGVTIDVQAFDWSHFWVVQMCLAILIFAYTSLMVFVRDLGHESVYDAFFASAE